MPDFTGMIEKDAAGAGGSLVNRKNELSMGRPDL